MVIRKENLLKHEYEISAPSTFRGPGSPVKKSHIQEALHLSQRALNMENYYFPSNHHQIIVEEKWTILTKEH